MSCNVKHTSIFFRQKDFFDATTLKTIEDFIGGQDALIFTYGVTSSGIISICIYFKLLVYQHSTI